LCLIWFLENKVEYQKLRVEKVVLINAI
jgi:hypothetical protein